jgi:membrane protease YdiL (CAAX protease family)
MIISIIITLLAVSLSVAIRYTSLFKEDVLFRRLIASLVLAWPVVTALLFFGDQHELGLAFTRPTETIIISVFLSLITAVIIYFSAGKEENMAMYPQLRTAYWPPVLVFQNYFSWVIYLVAYEVLFRGYLFFASLEQYGLAAAIIVNLILYALAHLPMSIKESLLTIPFGFLLCMITRYTGNVWSAVFIHIALAVANDYFAFRANPNMTYSAKQQTV